MFAFRPSAYGPRIAELLADDRLNELGPGEPNEELRGALQALAPSDIATELQDPDMADCCIAGLWLWHDFLDASHQVSQEINGPCGSYWHGIMHRREPDYSNAKYWFRRVGDHEIFPALSALAKQASQQDDVPQDAVRFAARSSWDPFAFVDLCESAASSRASDLSRYCPTLARYEWQLLFDYCFHRA